MFILRFQRRFVLLKSYNTISHLRRERVLGRDLNSSNGCGFSRCTSPGTLRIVGRYVDLCRRYGDKSAVRDAFAAQDANVLPARTTCSVLIRRFYRINLRRVRRAGAAKNIFPRTQITTRASVSLAVRFRGICARARRGGVVFAPGTPRVRRFVFVFIAVGTPTVRTETTRGSCSDRLRR